MVKNKFINYYNSAVKKKIESHLFQLELVNRLNEVFELVFSSKKFFSRFNKSNITSTYVFGLPGGGKTYIANIFLKFLKENKLEKNFFKSPFSRIYVNGA